LTALSQHGPSERQAFADAHKPAHSVVIIALRDMVPGRHWTSYVAGLLAAWSNVRHMFERFKVSIIVTSATFEGSTRKLFLAN
jgi:hypothetical protein